MICRAAIPGIDMLHSRLQLVLLVGTVVSESRIVLIFLISGLLSAAMSLVHDLVLYREGSGYEMDGVVMSQATGTLLFAAVAVFFRKRLLVRATLLVRIGI